MKQLGKIGLILGILCLLFGLYILFIVKPASEIAEAQMEQMAAASYPGEQEYYSMPEYREAMETSEKKSDYAGYLFFASMLPVLMCLIGSFKKDKMAWLGLIISLGAFFIGAAYGTHMFS